MDRLRRLCSETFQELTADILPFSIYFVVDREQGGFYGYVANDRTVHKEAPKALIQHSRMLWTFAHVERILSAPEYTPIALHAREALMHWFWDAKHDGFFWMVDHHGQPLQTDKVTYGQAFAIYALAECHLAHADVECLNRAIALYRLLETHCHDPECGGYWEACHQNWTPAPGQCVDEPRYRGKV